MSLSKIQSAFEQMNKSDVWSIQLLKIAPQKNTNTIYGAFAITLTPAGRLIEFIDEIVTRYIDPKNGILDSYIRVQDYDGTTDGHTIYKLDAHNSLVTNEYRLLTTALENIDHEANPLSQKMQAYVIQGSIEIEGTQTAVALVSMQNPITTLKHKFLYEKNTFKEITSNVLSLRPIIDVLMIGEDIYFTTMAGEKLFNMECAYKTICVNKISILKESGIFSDHATFESVATSGHHPRMFVSFNEKRLEILRSKDARKQYSELFDIPLKGGKFDTSLPESADKLVKLLCNKGMVDPFEESPVEVSSARAWK